MHSPSILGADASRRREDDTTSADSSDDTEEIDDTAEVSCPICRESDSACEHVVAICDLNFASCDWGYACEHLDVFILLVEKAIRREVRRHSPGPPCLRDMDVDGVWEEIVTAAERSDFAFDPYLYIRLLASLLDGAGAIRLMAQVDGAPGFTSARAHIFSEDPKHVFEQMLRGLRRLAR